VGPGESISHHTDSAQAFQHKSACPDGPVSLRSFSDHEDATNHYKHSDEIESTANSERFFRRVGAGGAGGKRIASGGSSKTGTSAAGCTATNNDTSVNRNLILLHRHGVEMLHRNAEACGRGEHIECLSY